MHKVLLMMLLLTGVNVSAQEIKIVKMDDVVTMIRESKEPIIVNFWATWCAPCVHEIPWFEKHVYADSMPKAKLLLVSLDFQEDVPAKLKAFVKKNHYRSQVVWLSESNADSFCPKIDASWEGAIPASLFVNNATGYRKFYGRQLTEEQFKLELAALVQKK
ncbi:TlpA disulfide reductase family protein [Filimonas effusa]|uniref:TlpA family protein disulfide reductase n=1 Tax=Filimonas effusa TaxID=2508721 RepID=A0A4Q1DBK9_9BACT|nr:TlpA disulfide reductase family protein [Filimonas effusa]RXK86308.1 TlpA family protein disulfide reductase [Filimonas effusa]